MILKTGAAVLLLGLISGCATDPAHRTDQRRPRNLVLISIDTCRADHLGAYGETEGVTPNLDRFADRSTVFERAYSPVPLTLPAHASMLTGLVPPQHGLRDNFDRQMGPNLATLPEVLQGSGFQTAAFISTEILDSRFGLQRGFDLYDDEVSGRAKDLRNTPERCAADTIARAQEWLNTNSRQPFFLFVHLYDAHFPYEPPEPWRSEFAHRPYAGEIAAIDHSLGSLFNTLEKLGLAKKTAVIVTADHGEMLGGHGEPTHGYLINEAAVRVPLLIHVPGQPAKRIPTPVSLIDIPLTVCDILRVTPDQILGGQSLAGYDTGGAQTESKRSIYLESVVPSIYGATPWEGLVRGRWKLIRSMQPQLFDLTTDPQEAHNLAAEKPATLAELDSELKYRLAGWKERDQNDTVAADLSEEAKQRLRALGYVDGPTLSEHHHKTVDAADRLTLHLATSTVQGLLAVGRIDEGVIAARQLVEKHDDFEKGYLLLADAETYLGHSDKAQHVLEGASQRFPTSSEIHLDLGVRLAATGQADQAKEHFGHVTLLAPEDPRGWSNLGGVLLETGHADEALLAYRQALDLQPEHLTSLYGYGLALMRLDRLEEAVAQLKTAAQVGKNEPEIQGDLAMACWITKDLGCARKAWTQLLDLNPDDIDANNSLAWLFATTANLDLAERDHAVQLARHASDLSGGQDPSTLDTLAAALASAGQWTEAVTTAELAVKIAKKQGQGELANRINQRLEGYREEQRALP